MEIIITCLARNLQHLIFMSRKSSTFIDLLDLLASTI